MADSLLDSLLSPAVMQTTTGKPWIIVDSRLLHVVIPILIDSFQLHTSAQILSLL